MLLRRYFARFCCSFQFEILTAKIWLLWLANAFLRLVLSSLSERFLLWYFFSPFLILIFLLFLLGYPFTVLFCADISTAWIYSAAFRSILMSVIGRSFCGLKCDPIVSSLIRLSSSPDRPWPRTGRGCCCQKRASRGRSRTGSYRRTRYKDRILITKNGKKIDLILRFFLVVCNHY